jgi:hypothetical protein
MRSRSVVGLLCVAAIALVTPGAAFAAAPVLNSVAVVDGQALIQWSLPPCVESRFVETATTKTTDRYGHFSPQNNVYSFDIPGNFVSDTSLIPNDPLNGKFLPGTYYAHVGGEDRSQPPPRLRQFSNIVQFSVDGSGKSFDVSGGEPAFDAAPCPTGSGGGGAAGGGGSGGGTVNKVTPFGALSYPRLQHIRRLFVIARSTEAGKLRAVGSVSVPGAAKVYKFRPLSMKVGANALVNLRLRLSKKNLAAVSRALKKGRRLTAKITVTATNGAGVARSQKATIKLKA